MLSVIIYYVEFQYIQHTKSIHMYNQNSPGRTIVSRNRKQGLQKGPKRNLEKSVAKIYDSIKRPFDLLGLYASHLVGLIL